MCDYCKTTCKFDSLEQLVDAGDAAAIAAVVLHSWAPTPGKEVWSLALHLASAVEHIDYFLRKK